MLPLFFALAKKTIMCYNGSMNKSLINQIDEMLNNIDFTAIWPDFAPCDFALYDKETVHLRNRQMPWDARFSGNTAIMLDDAPLAIWHVENPDEIDIRRLTANLVHEMFHAFQGEKGDTRHPDEFALLDYPHDLDNYRLKLAENHYLVKAVTDNSMMDLQQFSVLREARRRIVGEAMEQEQRAETVEGMAEYAGLTALGQLSRTKLMEEIQAHLTILRSPRDLFDIRRVSYSVGCLLCFALKSLGIDFYHDLSDRRTIYDFIPQELNEIETNFMKIQQDKQKRFNDFLANHYERIGCSAEITGLDPINMEKLGDEFLCYNFVKLGDLYVKGPVMLEMAAGSLRQVVSYIK